MCKKAVLMNGDFKPLKIILHTWASPDSDTGEDLAEEVRKYHIPDFSNWKNHAAFERAFAPPTFHFGATSRLEKDLRASIGK